MDQSPRLGPLTLLLSVGNGLARTLLRSYKGRTISDRKPCVLYVQKIKPAVPIIASALLLA
jgi:hypothetical protein